MIEVVMSAVAIVVSVMTAVFVIVRKPKQGERSEQGPQGLIGPMGMRGADGKCWVYRQGSGETYDVGYYLPVIYTDNCDDNCTTFYVVKTYKREQDAAARVHYLNGGVK